MVEVVVKQESVNQEEKRTVTDWTEVRVARERSLPERV